jgi:nucleoside-diphosphate-sugar epimerase
MAKLIFGCGYLGLRVARLWKAAGHTVFAVSRSKQRAEDLAREGLRPLVANVTSREPLPIPQEVDSVLYAVGYDRQSAASIHEVYVSGLRRVLDTLPDSVQRVTYISSTGV